MWGWTGAFASWKDEQKEISNLVSEKMEEEQENWQLDQRQTFGKREKTEDVERDLLG